MENIELLHDIVASKRESYKISYKKMGDVISYSDVGMKKALKNKTLSIQQLQKIIDEFEFKLPSSNMLAKEPETSYQEDLLEYNEELIRYKAKTLNELRDIAYKFLANEKELYQHHLLPDNREMHFWLRYKEIVDKYGSVDNYLKQEV
jgi:hypothetical protein